MKIGERPLIRPPSRPATPAPSSRPDGFRPSLPDPGLIPRGLRWTPPQQDVKSIADDPNLHGVDLNRAINQTYLGLADDFQKIFDPRFDGESEVAPSWYAMAIYASRMAGKGMLAAQTALRIVEKFDQPRRGLEEAFPQIPSQDWDGLELEPKRGGQLAKATAFLTAFYLAQKERPDRVSLDPRVLTISAHRLAALLFHPEMDLTKFTRTVLNMLEDGNRRIFRDIGVAGQDFLKLRAENPQLSPEQVLSHFSDRPELAGQAYQDGLRWAGQESPLPSNFEELYSFDSHHLLAAGLGLYQRAAQESRPEVRDRLIAHAGNLLAYHEQATVAVPAFLPGQDLPGEANRAQVMQILTPQIDVQTRHWKWEYSRFPQEDLDGSRWTPPCTEHNWGLFEDRWPGIQNYFERCFQRPESLWPMPCYDPALPLDGRP